MIEPAASGLQFYDAKRTLEHEIDEVLAGLTSALPSTGVKPEDLLFVFPLPAPRSLTSNSGATAYFSIDGGVTNIVSLNQSGGDFGDWLFLSCAVGTSQLVQTFGSCPGVPADILATSPEGIALDVIGFTLRTGGIPQTIAFSELSDVNIDAVPFALSASASSGLPLSFTSNNNSVCTVVAGTVTLVTVGACSITAGQSGNSAYAAAATVTRTFIITGTGAEASITIAMLVSRRSLVPELVDCSGEYSGSGCRFTGDGNVPGWNASGTGQNGLLQIAPKSLQYTDARSRGANRRTNQQRLVISNPDRFSSSLHDICIPSGRWPTP